MRCAAAPAGPSADTAKPAAPTPTPPTRVLVPVSTVDAAPPRDATLDATPPDAATEASSAPPPIDRIVVEAPHRLYERPRPRGQVAAAGADETLARWNVGGTGDPDFKSNRRGYHPGARVRVDTQLLRGRMPKRLRRNRRTGRYPKVLSHRSLLARSRKYGYWPFRLCFEDGLRENQRLKGKTVLRLVINGRGRVSSARLSSSKLKDTVVVECLRDRARALTYPPPPRGRSVVVRLTVALWPGDAPVLRVGPPRGESFDNPGKIDETALEKSLATLVPQVADCYAQGLARDSGLWGRIALRLDVSERGKLGRVKEYESRFPDRSVSRCVRKLAGTMRLPAPEGGAVSVVAAFRLGQPPEPKPVEADAGGTNADKDARAD